MIQGIADNLINTEVDTILADIDLKDKANAIAFAVIFSVYKTIVYATPGVVSTTVKF